MKSKEIVTTIDNEKTLQVNIGEFNDFGIWVELDDEDFGLLALLDIHGFIQQFHNTSKRSIPQHSEIYVYDMQFSVVSVSMSKNMYSYKLLEIES